MHDISEHNRNNGRTTVIQLIQNLWPCSSRFLVGSLFFKSIIDQSPFARSFITIIVSAVKWEMWFSSAAPTDGASAALQSAADRLPAGQPLPRWSEWAHRSGSLSHCLREICTQQRDGAFPVLLDGSSVPHNHVNRNNTALGCCSDCLLSLFLLNIILP